MPSREATRQNAISRKFGKRALDVAISALGIVVAAPVFVVVWVHFDYTSRQAILAWGGGATQPAFLNSGEAWNSLKL